MLTIYLEIKEAVIASCNDAISIGSSLYASFQDHHGY